MLQATKIFALSTAVFVCACMRGPGFMKQTGAVDVRQAGWTGVVPPEPEIPIQVLETKIEGEAATGQVSADSTAIQLLPAAQNSIIAGATAEFPPGTIALATEITIQPGASIANSSVVSDLKLSNLIAASAPPVTVSAALMQDTVQPFTVALPLPDEAALRLLADNSFEKLVVLYRVQSVADNMEKAGFVTRANLVIKDNMVRFQTRHFGTFQAIYTVEVLSEPAKELVGPAITPKPTRKTWYVAGPTGVVFANDSERGAGLQGWFLGFTPATVNNFERVLQTSAISKISKEQ